MGAELFHHRAHAMAKVIFHITLLKNPRAKMDPLRYLSCPEQFTMSPFHCLHRLESPYLYIIEVKRSDLPENATAAERSHWLKIDRESMSVSPLALRSMDSSGEVEERYFEEGFLKFSQASGTFIEKYNSAQHALHRHPEAEIPGETESAIAAFLAQLVST